MLPNPPGTPTLSSNTIGVIMELFAGARHNPADPGAVEVANRYGPAYQEFLALAQAQQKAALAEDEIGGQPAMNGTTVAGLAAS